MAEKKKSGRLTTGSWAARPSDKAEAQRLSRNLLGHAQAIDRMVTEERYCVEVLKQIAAVKALTARLADTMSEAHMQHCVREAMEEGQGEEKIGELLETMKYLRRV